MTRLTGPLPLSPGDPVGDFSSGEPEIDGWLAQRAHRAEKSRTARTYVAIDLDSGLIAGYFCLSAHSVARESIGGGWLARNSPELVPVVLLGRLGVDRRYQENHLGAALLKDAILRTIAVARTIGARALLVDALTETAAGFYEHYGFRRVPGSPQTLFLPLERMMEADS